MSASPVNVGDTLAGKYQVERVLGAGGMGVVVAAKHLHLGERVAIKFLLPQALARADVVERFKREGRAAFRIKSEHVARVIDVGELKGGEPYLVMEYLDGQDLGAILREKGLFTIETAVEYVLQACLALAEAHAVGIVHRDLKPSNLFLIKASDGSPTIKIIDFGISKMASADGSEGGGEMTQTAVMMGSPLYMAPEQMASARDVDGRADIWSLGIILYTLLTGSPPFKAPSVMQIYELIVQGAPPLRQARPSAPEGLEAVLLTCLQKDRKKRYGDVGQLADALAEFGPAHARYVADRVKRIVRSRSMASIPPPTPDPPAATAVTPTGEGSQAAGKGAATKPGIGDPPAVKRPGSSETPPPVNPPTLEPSQPDLTSSVPSPTGLSSPGDAQGTGGPWSEPRRSSARRSRVAMIAASVAALVIGGPLAFYLLRGHAGTAPVAPASDSAAVHVSTAPTAPLGPPSADANRPVVAPDSATPVTATAPPPPVPSAEPTATASSAGPGRDKRRPPPPPPGPGPTPKKSSSPDDLFKDQGVIRR
jgi:serine/threonine protein kinase